MRNLLPGLLLIMLPAARLMAIPLHDAAIRGDIVSMQSLIDRDARAVHTANADGDTPLHSAALAGRAMAVQFLLAHGADVNARNPHTGSTPLLAAAMMNHRTVAEILLAGGARINLASRQGTTPLHVAAYQGHRRMVEFLLARGADVTARDQTGLTPVQWALMTNHKQIAVLLLQSDPEMLSAAELPPEPPPPANEQESAQLREQILALTRALREAEQGRQTARHELEQSEIRHREKLRRLQDDLDRKRDEGDQTLQSLQTRLQQAHARIAELEQQIAMLIDYTSHMEPHGSTAELERLRARVTEMAMAARETEVNQQIINNEIEQLRLLLARVRQGLQKLQTMQAAQREQDAHNRKPRAKSPAAIDPP